MSLLIKVDHGEVELEVGCFMYAEQYDPVSGTLTGSVYHDWEDAPADLDELIEQGNHLFEQISGRLAD